ncbi:sulfotransferase family 2 domain-containing protein [Alkalihalobacterium alkalinitrilicum]|uniref:sulfotransferase family 2 domain-containing protein n=1 Tax=Alkalihalobacterium alkalinitrilicum TaxID=427920 RepID=UPI000994EB23|nr:sulfotransferase family 2 domain-containing protein [Alkalihalobacterium alkalinitrilicum]
MRNQIAEVLIHLHMPKTAGTTLRTIIKQNVDSSKSYELYRYGNQLSKILSNLNQKDIKCIQGHFPYGIHELLDQKAIYITMLRNPVERVISEYYFIKSIPRHELHQQVKKMTLTEYQQELRNCNLQTRLLSGKVTKEVLSQEDIQQAKVNIKKHFKIVGITELFNESIFLMQKEFGWMNIFYKKYNITRGKPTNIADSTLDKISKNNVLDIELYNYAREILKTKLNALNEIERNKLLQFTIRQQSH